MGQRAEDQTKKNYSPTLRSNDTCLARFCTCLAPSPLSSNFSLLEWECVPSLLHDHILKHITFLVSQVRTQRGVLPQEESYLEGVSPIPDRYLDDTLDFRVGAGIGWDFWDGINIFRIYSQF